jgi:hypothetical protein
MSISSLVLALAAAAPAQNAIAVDATGDRVALQSGPASVAVYERRGGDWLPLAAGKRFPDFTFVGAHFVQARTVPALKDKRIAATGRPIAGLEPGMSVYPALVTGDLAFFWTETFSLGGVIVAATDDALKHVATIAPIEGIGNSMSQGSGLVAFSGERIVVVDQSSNDQGCQVSVLERGEGNWTEHAEFRPQDCEPGGDDFAPVPPRLEVIGVALDGDRLALGTEPANGIAAGEVLLYRRGKHGWKPAGRIARPVQDDEPADDEGFVPHGFGRRMVLSGPRIYISDTWSIPTESGYNSVYNGVMVMLERDGQWQLERHYVHATRQAMFGSDFEVRGERLFIDSPNEFAVYVFERRGGDWQPAGRIPKDEPTAKDPKAD